MKRPCDTCGRASCAEGRGYDWKSCERYREWVHSHWEKLSDGAKRLDNIHWMLRHLRLEDKH